jgi:hypothetical protein
MTLAYELLYEAVLMIEGDRIKCPLHDFFTLHYKMGISLNSRQIENEIGQYLEILEVANTEY